MFRTAAVMAVVVTMTDGKDGGTVNVDNGGESKEAGVTDVIGRVVVVVMVSK